MNGFTRFGSRYESFRGLSRLGSQWADPEDPHRWTGAVTFEYPNRQRATTLWYHDHTLGMTRQNVYAGPAGFYIIRGGRHDRVDGDLPGPAPRRKDRPGVRYREIPIVIQDRSFYDDGSLYYPSDRAFFEGLEPEQLQIPFIGDPDTASDVPPIWNPEFFGDVMVTNGVSWPYLDVEPVRYRLRLLNGCNSRFLILRFELPLSFWQIGSEGGFLPAPVELDELLIAPAERADVIVDFGSLPPGTRVRLLNFGPDDPFGGGEIGADFDPADPATTGQVMEFRVQECSSDEDDDDDDEWDRGESGDDDDDDDDGDDDDDDGDDDDCEDESTHPSDLELPRITRLPAQVDQVRQLSLNELESELVNVIEDQDGNIVAVPEGGEPFGPTSALLGTLNPDGSGNPLLWTDPAGITETPTLGATEIWEIHNFTADAHPIHIHLVQFEVVNREVSAENSPNYVDNGSGGNNIGAVRGPESWETGFKDTVIAYPGEITRVKARFSLVGLFVWHCHILENEDNEMMRRFEVLDPGS